VPALEADHTLRLLGQPVDDLAFAFVAHWVPTTTTFRAITFPIRSAKEALRNRS